MAFSQTKTAQGYIPFLGVSRDTDDLPVHEEDSCQDIRECRYLFDLIAPVNLDEYLRSQDKRALRPEKNIELVDLGSCFREIEGILRPDPRLVFEVASVVGPLFGAPTGSERERSWFYAAHVAMLACRIQECVNMRKPIAALSALNVLNKLAVRKPSGETLFTVIETAILAYGDYARLFGRLPVVRRTVRGDAYEYAFALSVRGDDGEQYIEFIVVSLEHELTVAEFNYLLNLFQVDEQTGEALRDKTELLPTAESWEEAEALPAGGALEEADLRALEALVQVIIVAHLGNVRVDVFNGNQETGYLSFDCYLSWLWYDFSRSLSQIKLGYCESCGRAFSLVGHRGIDRRYCSEACKTKEKNERTKKQRDLVRSLYVNEGLSVPQIAERLNMKGLAAERSIRANLSQWVGLKHMLNDELSEIDFRTAPLFNRCLDNGLDITRLLSTPLQKRLVQEVRISHERADGVDLAFLQRLAKARGDKLK